MTKKLTKGIGVVLIVLSAALCLNGCAGSSETSSSVSNDGKVVVTQSGNHPYLTADNRYGAELFCAFKNNSNQTLDISRVTFTLYNQDDASMGSILSVYAPQYLKPGDTGYAAVTVKPDSTSPKIHDGSEPARFEVTFRFKVAASDYTDNTLNVTAAKLNQESKMIPSIAYTLDNTLDKEVTQFSAVAGLFDANGTLTGCFYNDTAADNNVILSNWNARFILGSWADSTDYNRFANVTTVDIKACATRYK
ncbi:MAG: FxLYD domain-containing protein [Eubacteriaceae bacterium]|nr:FxLYD domain-containing protein [Eubacteriaceae bacterium]MDD4508460.1 FxLYD domain-containing protein [Eubacteriaceae bacterium]